MRSTPRRGRLAVLATAALAVGALAAPTGAGASVALSGGSTTLSLDRKAAAALADLGVSVAPISPAKAGSKGISFPVRRGEIHPSTARGTIDHRGGLRLSAGDTTLRLTSFSVRVSKDPTLRLTVNGASKLTAFTLDLSKAKVSRSGFGTSVSKVGVVLSGKGAAALNATFGVHAFAKGLRIGTATVRTTPAELQFKGGATALSLDPATASALTGLGVAVAPVGPAAANPDGSIGFPITGGKVNGTTLAGTIAHSGGLSFTAGSTVVTASAFVIDTTGTKLTADVGGTRIDLLTLDLGALTKTVSGRTVTLSGVKATLTAASASALNAAFGTTALSASTPIGVATVTAQGV